MPCKCSPFGEQWRKTCYENLSVAIELELNKQHFAEIALLEVFNRVPPVGIRLLEKLKRLRLFPAWDTRYNLKSFLSLSTKLSECRDSWWEGSPFFSPQHHLTVPTPLKVKRSCLNHLYPRSPWRWMWQLWTLRPCHHLLLQSFAISGEQVWNTILQNRIVPQITNRAALERG